MARRWVNEVDAVGTASQDILAWRVGWGLSSDAIYLSGVRRDARRSGHYQVRRTASWFDGHAVRDDDLVPPIRCGGTCAILSAQRRPTWVLRRA